VDSSDIVKAFRNRFGTIIGQWTRRDERPAFSHRASWLLRLSGHHRRNRALEQVLVEMGRPVELGAGLKAAQQVYAEATQPAVAVR